MRLGTPFGVDDTTLQVVDGVISLKSSLTVKFTEELNEGGSGTALTLSHTPVSNSLQLFKNGILMKEGSGSGYTISGTAITLTTSKKTTDWIRADYEY